MSDALSDYSSIISSPETEWNLFEISLHLSRIIQPQLGLDRYRVYLEELTEQVRAKLTDTSGPYERINALNDVLFEARRFRGNQGDYYNPKNSYMSCVLEEKKGIPITLSVLYQEIAARLGMKLFCVGMPGHFLLKYPMPFRELFIDAFFRGEILLEEQCKQRLHQLFKKKVEFRVEFLQVISPRAVVLRILMNLKQIYRRQNSPALLLEVLERRIPLLDDPLSEILERGLVKLDLDRYGSALEDLEFFANKTPDLGMKRLIEQRLDAIRPLARRN